jgi:hypothetical protein
MTLALLLLSLGGNVLSAQFRQHKAAGKRRVIVQRLVGQLYRIDVVRVHEAPCGGLRCFRLAGSRSFSGAPQALLKPPQYIEALAHLLGRIE